VSVRPQTRTAAAQGTLAALSRRQRTSAVPVGKIIAVTGRTARTLYTSLTASTTRPDRVGDQLLS
jgi:hypothetical protein